MNENDALLILNAVSGLGNARIRNLIERFGSTVEVLKLKERVLREENLLPHEVIKNLLQFPYDKFLKEEYELMKRHQVNLIPYFSSDYSKNLREIPDAPVILYVKGDLALISDMAVAMVGSRRASLYGLSVAQKFSCALAELGITIVSGMARGIDTASHRGCLKARGSTVAVMGCGLSQIYPPENKQLFKEIAQSGAIISEFPMEMQPLGFNFPRRNRIISGLSLGVIVVEASLKSGALVTAQFALEQGREVFAVPGHVDHPNSAGVHSLIKQGAKLVNCIDDVLEELKPQFEFHREEEKNLEPKPQRPHPAIGLTSQEENIYNHLSDHPIHIDDLVHQCDFSFPNLMSLLLSLELKHCVRQLPGKLFVKVANG